MKAQSKNRKSPTCSRCRFHGERDVRVLQHKCPYKDCSCSDCLLVKKRSIIYRAQKNLDKQDENSNEVSSPGSGSTGSSRCLGSPQMPVHSGSHGDNSESSGQPWAHLQQQPQPQPPPPQQQQPPQPLLPPQQSQPLSQSSATPATLATAAPLPPPQPTPTINSINRNIGYSYIKNFQTLCLTFPDHSPSQLQTLFEQCGNDFEKTIDKILMSKWYSDPPVSTSEYNFSNDQNYNSNNGNSNLSNYSSNNNNSLTNNNNSNNIEYPGNEEDTRLSFANCSYNHHHHHHHHHNQSNHHQRSLSSMMTNTISFHNQDYPGDEMATRSAQPINPNLLASDWSGYSDTPSARYSNYQSNNNNNWSQSDYSAWSQANSNFWPNNGHTYSTYAEQSDVNNLPGYYYGRREVDYTDSTVHLERVVRPEIGSNISSNFDFDSY